MAANGSILAQDTRCRRTSGVSASTAQPSAATSFAAIRA